MNAPLFHPPPAEADASPLTRIVRRICLLREQGDEAEAMRLHEQELADAVRVFRLKHGPEALPESELREMFATEERRVAEAVILSQLLIPQLVGSRPAAAPTKPVVAPAPAPAASRALSAGPPAIPDLLDAMLASERATRRAS